MSSTVEINGKVYNLVEPRLKPRNAHTTPAITNPKAEVNTFRDVTSSRPQRSNRQTTPNHTKRKIAKSQTLVRANAKPRIKPLVTPQKDGFVVTKASHAPQKSPLITKFHKSTSNPQAVAIKQASVAVKNHPEHAQKLTQHLAHLTLEHIESNIQHKVVDPFEEAIKDATSHVHNYHHVESPLKRITKILHPFGSRTRSALTTSVLLAVFVVGAYQTIPEARMKMASVKANIPASLPAYRPVGFGIDGPVKSEPGKVEVTYKSNSNDSQFKITQQASNWTSESLLNNQVLASSKPFQTFQQNGKTVYIYDDKNAVWVNGGLMYSVEGSQGLNQDQLLKIAESL